MRVLVTGAAGLIGLNTCKYYLEQGAEVVAVDNLERSELLGHEVSLKRRTHNWRLLNDLGAQTIFLDVSDSFAMRNTPAFFDGFDVVVHLAGQCGVPTSIANPRRDFEVNAIGTFNVLEMVRNTKRGRVVYASTNKTYPLHGGWGLDTATSRWSWLPQDWHNYGFPIDGELTHPDYLGGSRTPYGTSKYVGDLLMQEYHYTYGIPTACFRMSCIYGPNQMGFEEQGWATWFIIAALKGLPITIYGDGCQVRDMLFVEDLVKAYDAFVQHKSLNHGIWNIGGGPDNTLSLNECINFLRRDLGRQIDVEHKDWRPSDQRIYTSDIRPLELDLKWAPIINPRIGLKLTAEWVAANLELF